VFFEKYSLLSTKIVEKYLLEAKIICPKQKVICPKQKVICPKEKGSCPKEKGSYPKEKGIFLNEKVIFPKRKRQLLHLLPIFNRKRRKLEYTSLFSILFL
jgi:hypothetical protein